MGNTISESECNERESIMKNIVARDYPILDIGQKVGHTGYIDFIKESDVPDPVMKGIDMHNRPFFVVNANVINIDGTKTKLFETFFQRYSNDKYLWHGCGHHGIQFMATEGGMQTNQMKFLQKRLENGKVELSEELIDDLRLMYYLRQSYTENEANPIFTSIELA